VFSSVKNPRCKSYGDWKATPFGVNNYELGGSSMIERVVCVFSKGGNQLKTVVDQVTARNVSSFCKDHQFGN
jgi:hypothetical protein